MDSNTRNRNSRRGQKIDGTEGVDFIRCRICGDHRRVISGRNLSKHGTDREEYMQEYGLSPDELIAKDFRIIQSSRRGYQAYGKRDWIAAIKKIHRNEGSAFAGNLQKKYPYLYHQGIWLFGAWDNALRARDSTQNRRGCAGSGTRKKLSMNYSGCESETYLSMPIT